MNEIRELLEKREDWGIAFRKASGDPYKAIKTLLEHQKGFVPSAFNKNGIGHIDAVYGKPGKKGYGIAHIEEKRHNEGYNTNSFINKIPKNIQNGKLVPTPEQPDIHHIKNNHNTIIIKKNFNNKKHKWLLTSFDEYKKHPNALGRSPDIAQNYTEMSPSARLDTNIITNISTKVKPNTLTEAGTKLSNQEIQVACNAKNTTIFHLNANNSHFTQEQIDKMSTKEFDANEKEIMEQMQLGLIRPVIKDYTGYKNRDTATNHIYTREEIGQMTREEFEINENEIYAQMETIGIPTNKELQDNNVSRGVVYVRAYIKDDGTKVKSHYRSLPNY